MAMTHDYLDLLDEKVGISPTNSEEEFQAAGVIADLMAQHNVEPSIEEFSVPVLTGLAPALLAVLCLVGVVLAGWGFCRSPSWASCWPPRPPSSRSCTCLGGPRASRLVPARRARTSWRFIVPAGRS